MKFARLNFNDYDHNMRNSSYAAKFLFQYGMEIKLISDYYTCIFEEN